MKNFLSIVFIFITLGVFGQGDKYKFFLDLNKINSDLIQIELKNPTITSEKIIYNIPKIVPYMTSDNTPWILKPLIKMVGH